MKDYKEEKTANFKRTLAVLLPVLSQVIVHFHTGHKPLKIRTPVFGPFIYHNPPSVLVTLINCQVILFPTSSTANVSNKSYTKQMCHTHKLEAKLELQTMPVNFSVERGPVKDKMAKRTEKKQKKKAETSPFRFCIMLGALVQIYVMSQKNVRWHKVHSQISPNTHTDWVCMCVRQREREGNPLLWLNISTRQSVIQSHTHDLCPFAGSAL